MNELEVLVLNGAPGSGKSTLASAISDGLRKAGIAHVVIEVDELACVFPEAGMTIQWENLRSVWPNYAALGKLKVILPVVIDDRKDLLALRDAVPAKSLTICELTASSEILKKRVTDREPNHYWKSKLRGLIDEYERREEKFGDFQVNTETSDIEQSVKKIVDHLGWSS